MVARPPVAVIVDRMTVDDLPAVHEIERASFSTPWPAHAYRQELERNRLAHYLVARYDDQVVGFAGIWLLVDEAHITTFATRPGWRRLGIGERLLIAALELAESRGASEATLEVRPSNTAARSLYEKYGFRVVGVRPRYYSDNNEDALIMTTDSLESRQMRARLMFLRNDVARRPDIEIGPDGLPVRPSGADEWTDQGEGPASAGRTGDTGSDPPLPGEWTESGPTSTDRPRIIRPSRTSRKTL
jgi:ribosomal-protein-alanine N-acetyltransferase